MVLSSIRYYPLKKSYFLCSILAIRHILARGTTSVLTNSNELIGQVLGTCTLQRLLGRGGMGAVYLARQSRPRRTVAVKVILPSLIEEQTREEFLARFRRPFSMDI